MKFQKIFLNNLEIIFKPHPASRLNANSLTSLKLEQWRIQSQIYSFNQNCFCGSVTSAAVDAFSYGLKVIVLNDPNILNFSPLRNFREVSFVNEANELQKLSINFYENIYSVSKKLYSELTDDLPLWKKLLYKISKSNVVSKNI